MSNIDIFNNNDDKNLKEQSIILKLSSNKHKTNSIKDITNLYFLPSIKYSDILTTNNTYIYCTC